MTLKHALATLPQYILPHHFLSVLMSKFTHCEVSWWKNWMIKQIIARYGVNMQEAACEDITQFKSFNAFFTRELKPGLRLIDSASNSIACPADGAISQIGRIENGQIFQAKGHHFSAIELLGGDENRAAPFLNGQFTTIYLSPKDYHRLHMPFTGTLTEMVHVPGRLFSVNTITAETVPRLFARNERVVCLYDTEIGPMALVLVGAIFVSSIETTWHGIVTPPTQSEIRNWRYEDQALTLQKGDEMGRFNMGSTIIVLFGENAVQWNDDLISGQTVQLGQSLAHF